jgi:hypothetical protein
MAGLGYKKFVTGSVLAAADVQGYLADQAVQVYASAAARTSALGTSVASGMVSYRSDGTAVEYYNGSAWVELVDVSSPDALSNKTLTLSAGGTAVAPLKLTAGTNLTTQTAGAFEYDGNAVYATAGASGRSIANGSHYSISPRALTTGTTIQNLFSTGNGVLTLAASTTYEYELLLRITIAVSAPTVSSVVTMVTGATTTAHSATFDFGSNSTSLATTSALNTATVSGTTTNAIAQTVASGLGPGTNYCTVKVRGIIQTSGATTLTPSITISGGTISAAQLIAGSFIRVTPIGSSSVTSVGAWA